MQFKISEIWETFRNKSLTWFLLRSKTFSFPVITELGIFFWCCDSQAEEPSTFAIRWLQRFIWESFHSNTNMSVIEIIHMTIYWLHSIYISQNSSERSSFFTIRELSCCLGVTSGCCHSECSLFLCLVTFLLLLWKLQIINSAASLSTNACIDVCNW